MKEKSILCYLCKSEAKEQSEYDTSRNTVIHCSGDCKPYETTTESRKYFLDDNEKKRLSGSTKQKLILYLEKTHKSQPVRLTAELIESLVA